jgi:tetratricopeptide (TPR) repeat protein
MRERRVSAALAVISTMLLIGLSASAGKPQSTQNTEASKLDRRIQELYRAGKYSDAIPLATQSLHLREKALGPDHPDTATSLNNLGELYERMGEYTKAEPLLQGALKIREKVLGPGHPDTANSRNYLAQLYRKMGDSAKGEPLFQGAPKIKPQSTQNTEADKLDQRGQELFKVGKYSEAIPLVTQSLHLREKALGPEHPGTALSLNNLGYLYAEVGDYAKAGPLYERALKIREKVLGPNHPHTATSLNNLGELYNVMRDYAKAEPLLQRALKIREKALGPDHPATAESVNNLAMLYLHTRDYVKAEPLFQRALKIREKALGPDHPGTAQSLNNLAGLYQQKGDYAKAEPLFQRALKIREKAPGPDHPGTAQSLNNLAVLYRDTRDYAKAEPLFQRALKIREKALGPDHPGTAQSLNNLASIYYSMGSYAKAEPLLQRALQIREKALGADHAGTAESLNNLGELYNVVRDYAKAEPLLQRALKIKEKALGPEHPGTAESLNNLAWIYYSMGNYAKAEPLFQRALKIREKALGLEHAATAASLDSLASVYREMGNYAKAEPLFQRALKIDEKALGLEHPATATALRSLAWLYSFMGDYAKAEPLFQRALKIREKALGPDHPNTAQSLDNLASVYDSLGDHAKAEPLYQRALKIREKTLGPEHIQTAASLGNLAVLYMEMGDYAKAEPLYQRALKIDEKVVGPDHPYQTALGLNNLASLYMKTGDYAKAEPLDQRALKIREKALGPEHPATAQSLNNLAELYVGMGNPKEALRLAAQARRVQEKNLSDILSFTSEQQRLAFQKTTNPYDLPGTLGNAPELAETVLRQKGVVLDSLLEDRLVAKASGDPRQREIIEQLRAAKQRLTQLQLEVPKDLSEQAQKQRAAEKEKLSTEVEQLEGSLARQVAGLGHARRALSVTAQQVQSALPQQAALIELLRYSHYLGKDKHEPRYGAIVIGASGEPSWVPLGDAAEIEKNVGLYQKSVRGKTDEATLSTVLKALAEQVWAPIEKALPTGATTVIVSPDAELSFVSFATLVGSDDKFVGEKYSVRYVASGRDLLREFKIAGNSGTNVYANPDFGSKPASPDLNRETMVALRSLEMRDLQNISLPPLPGTAAEAAALAKRFGSSAKVFLGPNATKEELRQVNSPHILHLATHGFFLPEIELGKPNNVPEREEEIPKGKLVNPMHRSGLALAGAQTTLEAWSRGEVPPIENNGIVTAEEVGGLKLDGTWLVVLSACETGSGEAKAGEGVMGLRRGFIQAGAQNLLMTLWPISDQTTVKIMLDFYDAALKSGNAPQALADAERDWLVKLRKEHGLLDAVRLAGPFIMSSQGKH